MAEMNLEYLESLKNRSGLTQRQIADRTGVPIGTIGRILSGETVDPGVLTISELVYALGGSMDELMGHAPHDQHQRQIQITTMHDSIMSMCRDTFDTALNNSRDSFKNAFAQMQNVYEQKSKRDEEIIRDKNHWIKVLFYYTISITLAYIVTTVLFIAMQK